MYLFENKKDKTNSPFTEQRSEKHGDVGSFRTLFLQHLEFTRLEEKSFDRNRMLYQNNDIDKRHHTGILSNKKMDSIAEPIKTIEKKMITCKNSYCLFGTQG